MKKKLITLLTAIACAAAFAFGLAACKGGGDGGSGGGDPTITSLVIVAEDGKEYGEYDMGEYVYLQKPDLNSLSLYLKYSDDTKEQIYGDSDGVTTTYTHNGTEVEATNTFGLGSWFISLSYKNNAAGVRFDIVTSATATPYTLNVKDSAWSYLEKPEVTVYESAITSTPVDEEKFNLYYIEKDVYDEIKEAKDFGDKLNEKSSYLFSSTKPGSYYMFAYVSDGGRRYNSTFRPITIRKAKLTAEMMDDSTDFRAYFYYNGDVLGNIKLADIEIWGPTFKTTDGGAIWGNWVFVDGNTMVNSTNNGKNYSVKYVPEEEFAVYYEEYILPRTVTVEIEKGSVNLPAIYGAYSLNYYDGTEQEVLMNYYTNSMFESYQKLVTVRHGHNEIAFREDGFLGTHKEIGEYLYTFNLKDTTNYYWYNDSDYSDNTDNAQKAVWYNIIPIESYMSLYNDGGYFMDGNCIARIKIDPGVNIYGEAAVYNASPYKAGTLKVEYLSSYLRDGDYEYNRIYSEVSATVGVENDGEYDYIVITVRGFKAEDYRNFSGATVILKVTAEGDEHYNDIEYVSNSVKVVICEFESSQRIEVPVGTTIAQLYAMYPTLETALGKWEFYVWDKDEKDQYGYVKLEDSTEIEEGELGCYLIFAPANATETEVHSIYIYLVGAEQS